MYYVSEKTGDRTTFKPGNEPYRAFSDDEAIQAGEYSQMIHDRIKNENKMKKRLENNNNYSSTSDTDNSNSGNYRSAKMHWLYFILIGWWLGLTMACLIFPLFIKGLVKKSFGFW